ncbi:ectonucleoside triphosphate diphosphohydrolase 1 [Spea bombifrons]|uniref:ectonucleoside triphosphate diphosphohydrolase 1 n=1 Tax=Spea bombifrons TaxID=233779 RepID=UPI002349E1B9|nr:ectonucleoside triphosphate diphosphohydrolase 1 [Spea bombifrons]
MEEPKVAKQKKTWHKKVFFILGVPLALVVIALVITAVVQNKPLPKNIKYGIVLDAGSSHTSLYIYNWPAEKENDTGIVKQVEACKVEGNGVSSYFKEPVKAGLSLQTCINKAKEVIPQSQHKETPVYLGATAGMRLLRLANHTLADEVLSSVENTLRSSPFDFQGARIITGQEEGAYGWITINYLLNNFIQDSSRFNILPNFKKAETSGALDLGGASTQITFVSNEEIESQENSLHFRLYGKSYDVYTHSFLCYGKDQALRLHLAETIQNTNNDTLFDPCFNSGYRRNTSTTDLYSSPCVSELRTLAAPMNFEIKGTGDYDLCKRNIESIFNTTQCTYSTCSFNGIFQPMLQGKFGAFSAFFFVMDFLKINKEQVSLDEAKERVRKHCSRPWDEVKAEFPKIKVKYLSEYCFSGAYILILLEYGYGFTAKNWNDISFLGKIGGSDAGWTLGYMLNLTNMIPAELPPSPPLSHGGYVGLMVFFSILLFFILLTCWLCFRKPCLQKGII